MQVRDQALQIQDDLSRKDANRDYYVQNQERELAFTFDTTSNDAVAKISDSGSFFLTFSIFPLRCFLISS